MRGSGAAHEGYPTVTAPCHALPQLATKGGGRREVDQAMSDELGSAFSFMTGFDRVTDPGDQEGAIERIRVIFLLQRCDGSLDVREIKRADRRPTAVHPAFAGNLVQPVGASSPERQFGTIAGQLDRERGT